MSLGGVARWAFPFHPRSCCLKLLVSPVILHSELAIDGLSEFLLLVFEIGGKDGTNLSLRLFLYILSFEDESAYNRLMLWAIFVAKGVGPQEDVGRGRNAL